MSRDDFEQFRQMVAENPVLQDRLLSVTDRVAFIDLVIELGRKRDLVLTATDVQSALDAGLRSWVERWI